MSLVKFVNTFVTLAESDVYFAHDEEWLAADDDLKNQCLSEASRDLDNLSYIGTAVDSSQLMAFPRSGLTYYSLKLNTVVSVDTSNIPRELLTAVCELARVYQRDPLGIFGITEGPSKIQLGPLEIDDRQASNSNKSESTYKDSAKANYLKFLKPILLNNGLGSNLWWRAN